MSDRSRVEQLVLLEGVRFDESATARKRRRKPPLRECVLGRTGTFFWVMTTETPAPRMASEVCPDEVMALKAYSGGKRRTVSEPPLHSTMLFCVRETDRFGRAVLLD